MGVPQRLCGRAPVGNGRTILPLVERTPTGDQYITTIVTFLIVFLIQNTQNRDTMALHLKVDELLKATQGARNSMIDLDRLTDEQLATLEAQFKAICGDGGGDVLELVTEESHRRHRDKRKRDKRK